MRFKAIAYPNSSYFCAVVYKTMYDRHKEIDHQEQKSNSMKSNLITKKWLVCAVLLFMTVALIDGCKKKPENPETVSLTGMWYSNDQWFGTEHDCMAIDFINSNTLIWYGTISTNKNAFQDMEGISLEGCAGWYYFSKTYYTYVLADNKIVFNDRIFTIFENYLVEDGSSLQWVPWDDGNDTPPTVTVTTLNPTDITSTTATCGAEVTSGNDSNLKELGVCWGTAAYPTIEASHLSTTTCNAPFVCTISNLAPETKYHVRAYTKSGNNCIYGDDKTFTTLAGGGGGEGNCTVTVTANPANGGFVSGGGTYQLGEECTITATPNMGYSFVNWTCNGNVVSESATYAFTVLGSLDMVANFVYQASEHYTINVSANPSIGGSVSGGGRYQQGQTCTVNAVANTGYSFVNWTENGVQCSTNESYTFVVYGDRNLMANFTNNGTGNAPSGAINGKFTINENGDQVYFSQGNLQYKASTNTWRFAESQWNYVGGVCDGQEYGNVYENGVKCDNAQISQIYAGWIDLFGWGTSGYHDNSDLYNTNYQPYSTNTSEINETYNIFGYGPSTNMNNIDIAESNYDWGIYNAISNGGDREGFWRTLTTNEWFVVFRERDTQSGIRFVKAIVNGVNGVILLPDDWLADNYVLNNINDGTADYSGNTITYIQWDVFEQYGAVFLPAACTRKGTALNNGGMVGTYWTTTHTNARTAKGFSIRNGTTGYGGNYVRCLGVSVRLVCPAE